MTTSTLSSFRRPTLYERKLGTDVPAIKMGNTMAVCQFVFIIIDASCNLIGDCTSGDPMLALMLFVIQVLTILGNLICFLLSSHNFVQSSYANLRTRIHNINAVTTLAYLGLTIAWYLWSLRRSWPEADLNFRFAQHSHHQTNSSPGGFQNWTERFPFGSGFQHLADNREFSLLWSPGFITLYTFQRTMAVLCYVTQLKSISVSLSNTEVSDVDKPNGLEQICILNNYNGPTDFDNHLKQHRRADVSKDNLTASMPTPSFGIIDSERPISLERFPVSRQAPSESSPSSASLVTRSNRRGSGDHIAGGN